MIEIVLLVATLIIPGQPGSTRAVAADQPYYRTMAECQRAAMGMEHAPRAVDTVTCEPHRLDVQTGRVL